MKENNSQYMEGPEAFSKFDQEVRSLLSVPRSVLREREKKYKVIAESNPRKRGPKRKINPSASPDSAV